MLEIEEIKNQIIQGDCVKLLREVPDESVDVCFADSPFDLNKNYKTYSDNLGEKKYLEWCYEWLYSLVRITKPSGSIFVHNIPKWLTYYASYLNCTSAHFKNWIAWNAPSGSTTKGLSPDHYGILYYCKEPKENKFYQIRTQHSRCRKCKYLLKDYGGKKDTIHPIGPMVSDVWSDIHRIKHGKYRDDHPCQLPIPLMERIILMSSDPGDVILDNFSGTGTTARAAKRLGRNYIGFELSQDYVDLSVKKLETEVESKIGNIYVSQWLDKLLTVRDKDVPELLQYCEVPKNRADLDFQKVKVK